MKKTNVFLGIVLVVLSVLLHGIHYMVFRDLHHIMIFLLADVAFIPLEVFFVSLVLERIIEKQEEGKVVKKMNMLVGLFYQEVGNELLKIFVNVDKNSHFLTKDLMMNFNWESSNYKELNKEIREHKHEIDIRKLDLIMLHQILKKYKPEIVNLISNPLLLEKEYFSDVLMSTFHLYEELEHRNLQKLDIDDLEHLVIDCERVYRHLSIEWVIYMEHLQKAYPYLFWTAVKTNPFDFRKLSVIETELKMSV